MKKLYMIACFFMYFGQMALAQDFYAPPRMPRDTGPKGVQVYDPRNDANTRLGTKCSLVVEGDLVYEGICNVGRRDRITVIDTGTQKYRIVREEYTDRVGTLYKGLNINLGTVYARGNCWRSEDNSTRYCAN